MSYSYQDEVLPISKVLCEKTKENAYKSGTKCRVLDIIDNLVLIWNKEESCLLSQIVSDNEDNSQQIVQTLTLTRPPVWDVEKVVINQNGTGVMLMGWRGVAVVELPKRWGSPPLFDGGTDAIMCRVEYIGERFFSCNPKIGIIAAKWHPGSYDNSHISVLASDNYLRIYNISAREIPEQAIPVADVYKHNTSLSNASRFGGGSLLGETAVAFDFGPAIQSENSRKIADKRNKEISNVIDNGMEERKIFSELQWPVFILYGNGEVYYTITSLSRNRPHKRIVYGPLSMTPSSDDNYGLDYCSLLVLQSSPTVLVIGNSTGKLHHCIVVENSEQESDVDDDMSQYMLNSSVSDRVSIPSTKISLHVYESVQLEISICSEDNTTSSYSCPLVLHQDATTFSRYWVTHDSGVHGVAVPIVDQLNDFSQISEDADFEFPECECVVQHLLCTRQLSNSPALPVIGLGTFPIPNSQPKLTILLGSMAIKILPITNIYVSSIPDYKHSASESSNLKNKEYTESFEDHIRNILSRSTSHPFMTSSSSEGSINTQEYLSTLSRTTETLRRFYIQPQQTAREDIHRRYNMLKEQRNKLKSELLLLEEEKRQLTNNAHDLAEKYEEANYKHTELQDRLERVMNQIIRGMPLLSAAERTMLKELESMKDNSPELKNQLAQVKTKLDWQINQMEKHKMNESKKCQQSSTVNANYVKCMKKTLTKESDELAKLVQKVTLMKKDLNL